MELFHKTETTRYEFINSRYYCNRNFGVVLPRPSDDVCHEMRLYLEDIEGYIKLPIDSYKSELNQRNIIDVEKTKLKQRENVISH